MRGPLFLEEFADTRGVEVLSPALFERVIKKRFLGGEPDEARVEKVRREEAPPVFDQLEEWIESEEAAPSAASPWPTVRLALSCRTGRWQKSRSMGPVGRSSTPIAKRLLARPSFSKLADLMA